MRYKLCPGTEDNFTVVRRQRTLRPQKCYVRTPPLTQTAVLNFHVRTCTFLESYQAACNSHDTFLEIFIEMWNRGSCTHYASL